MTRFRILFTTKRILRFCWYKAREVGGTLKEDITRDPKGFLEWEVCYLLWAAIACIIGGWFAMHILNCIVAIWLCVILWGIREDISAWLAENWQRAGRAGQDAIIDNWKVQVLDPNVCAVIRKKHPALSTARHSLRQASGSQRGSRGV